MDTSGTSYISTQHRDKVNIWAVGVTIALAALPFVAFISPRLMAYVPALIAVIGAASGFFLQGNKPVWPKATALWVLGIIVLMGLSSLWSVDPGFAIDKTFKAALVLLPGGLLLALILSIKVEAIKPYLWLLPLFVGLAAVLNSVELIFDMPFYRLMRGLTMETNISHAGANRSIFCTVAAFFACIPVIYQMKFRAFSPHIMMGGLSVLVITMLLLSEGQSSQLCFIIALLSYFLFPYRFKFAWMVLAAVFAVLILSAPWTVQIIFKTLAASIKEGSWLAQGYATNRMEIWDFVARYALQSPFFGYGVEATRFIEDFDTQMIYHPDSMILHPHNFALQLWIEFGLIGAVIGSVFLGDILRRISQLSIEAMRVALPVFLCFLSVAATGYGMWQGWWLGEMMYMLALVTLVTRTFFKKA